MTTLDLIGIVGVYTYSSLAEKEVQMAGIKEPLDSVKIARLGQNCPLGHLRMATRMMEHIYDKILKPSGLSGSQLSVLAVTASIGPTNISNEVSSKSV